MERLNMEKLKGMVEHYALQYLAPDKIPTAKIDDAGTEEESLTFGMVVVYHGTTERKCIGHSIEIPCFDLGTIVEYGGGYFEPPEADWSPIEEGKDNLWSAALRVICLHLEMEISARMDADGEFEYWQEQQRLDAMMRGEDV